MRLLFLGRVEEPRKGLSVALRAFAAVAERHSEVVLDVAGPGDLQRVVGSLRPRLSGDVLSRVHALGPVDLPDKARLLGRADVVLAPQLGGESFGIVVAEAMAAGAAVVASDLPAFTRLLAHGERGVLVPRGDVAAWARALEELVLDPAERHRIGRLAGEGVDHLDWKRVADDLLEVYARALGQCSPGRIGFAPGRLPAYAGGCPSPGLRGPSAATQSRSGHLTDLVRTR